jgi:DNA topoisomerase VI subunit B
MEQNQQKRGAAAKKFLQSLNQLEDILQESLTEEEETPQTDTAKTSDAEIIEIKAEIDLEALEDAVADIEQYLEKKRK